MYRCPGGSTRSGGTCVNVNECLNNPCLHGGKCVDRDPVRRYDCICTFGYAGHDCELELLASGIIMPSRDFIIAIIVCLFLLLGEHLFVFACYPFLRYLGVNSFYILIITHVCLMFDQVNQLNLSLDSICRPK